MRSVLRRRRISPWVLVIVLPLLVIGTSCRRETDRFSTRSTAPNPTTTAPQPVPEEGNPLGGCSQCHVDCEDELAGTEHLAEGVGCIKCHGPSKGHAADENNEVLPDKLYAREDIDSFCGECHECPRETDHEPAVPRSEEKVCTDCHGPHDMKTPKATRNLSSNKRRRRTFFVARGLNPCGRTESGQLEAKPVSKVGLALLHSAGLSSVQHSAAFDRAAEGRNQTRMLDSPG